MSQRVSAAEFTARTSPLRRIIGVLGLVALVPTAWLLVHGQLTLKDAGIRAGVTLVAVRVVLRLTTWGIGHVVASIERPEQPADAEAG